MNPSTVTRAATRAGAFAVGVTLLLAACSDGEPAELAVSSDAPAQAENTTPAEAAPAEGGDRAAGDIHVLIGSTDLGEVLVGPDGRTLYGFTNDTEAASTCYGTCAEAWPPVIVPADWTAGPGLDFGIFATTVRDDGQHQLVAGRWPLYYFAGDTVAGDSNGQASGDVWFVVDRDGRLITDETAQPAADAADNEDGATGGLDGESSGLPVAVSTTDLGETLVDADGLTLYGFTQDENGVPSCYEDCADAWPPVTVDSGALPDGLDPDVFSIVTRDDGTSQLVAGKWPLYRFTGDAGPGDLNGQESGGVWFAAGPDGRLIIGEGPAESAPTTTSTTVDTGY